MFSSSERPRFETAPCGRCGRLTEYRKLGRLWWPPVWTMTLTLASPGEEGRRLYCTGCRKLLNRCVTFLALMGAAVALLLVFK